MQEEFCPGGEGKHALRVEDGEKGGQEEGRGMVYSGGVHRRRVCTTAAVVVEVAHKKVHQQGAEKGKEGEEEVE